MTTHQQTIVGEIMQISYTLVREKYFCPMWKTEVTITAKYRFFDEENPHIGKYASCSCPILENLKLPQNKRDKDLGLFLYCKKQEECTKSNIFPPVIDFE